MEATDIDRTKAQSKIDKLQTNTQKQQRGKRSSRQAEDDDGEARREATTKRRRTSATRGKANAEIGAAVPRRSVRNRTASGR